MKITVEEAVHTRRVLAILLTDGIVDNVTWRRILDYLDENTEEEPKVVINSSDPRVAKYIKGKPQRPCPECGATMLGVIAVDCDYECPVCGREE